MTLEDVALVVVALSDKLDGLSVKLDNVVATSQQPGKVWAFDEFARYYFETFRRRKVTAKTFKEDMYRYNAHILPTIGKIRLDELTPDKVQKLVDGLKDRPKTALEVFTLVNVVMKMAIRHNATAHNPCDVVILPEYEKQHGKALTKDEELRLLRSTAGTKYQTIYAVALYTGLRPNEYGTARISDGFIVARNSKQKDGKEHIKRIPIAPMLAPYIPDNGILPLAGRSSTIDHYKRALPDHKLYDMRTTFYTRCIECGISDIARKLFMGHTLGALGNAYTDISDDYLRQQMNKLRY